MANATQAIAVDDSRVQALIESLLPLDELFEKGRQRARLSCADTRLPEDLQVLEDYARAAALDVHTDPYDPGKNIQDQLREVEYGKSLNDRAQTEKALDMNVRPRLRDAEVKLASLTRNITQPKLSRVIVVAAVLVISLSVAPTLHDRFFFDLEDALLAWIISITGATFVASLITWSIVGAIDATGKRNMTNVGGLVAGIGISIATGVLRLSVAQTAEEYVFAIGLSLLEIFAVLILDWVAKGLRAGYREWVDYQETIAPAGEEVRVAQADLQRWEKQLSRFNEAVQKHIAYVEERWIRHHKVADFELAAVKSVIDGYDQGIAENKGRRLGLVVVK